MIEVLNGVLLILAGGIAGFLSGFFGMGGWFALVPLLIIFYRNVEVSSLVSTHLAFGTSFFAIGIASAVTAYRDAKNRQIAWKVMAIVGGVGAIGAIIGSSVAGGLVDQTIRKIFALVAGFSAISFFADGKRAKGEVSPNTSPPALASTGFLVGFVSSLAGVAVDAFLVPMMYRFFGFPLKKAMSTSRVIIATVVLAASAAFMAKGSGNVLLPERVTGYVDIVHALPIIAGIIPASLFAASISERMTSRRPRKFYGMLLIIIAATMFFS
jgi:uncharacterized membrane protein YfcA